MIPENREQSEKLANTENIAQSEKLTDVEKCIQSLEHYLRQETSYSAMSNEHVAAAMEKRLAIKAKDWGLKYKVNMPDRESVLLAREAITRYLRNWEDKKEGEDDRGHRLGKNSYL